MKVDHIDGNVDDASDRLSPLLAHLPTFANLVERAKNWALGYKKLGRLALEPRNWPIIYGRGSYRMKNGQDIAKGRAQQPKKQDMRSCSVTI